MKRGPLTREDVVAQLASVGETLDDEELDVFMELLGTRSVFEVGGLGELEHEMNLRYAELGRLLCDVTGMTRVALVHVLDAWVATRRPAPIEADERLRRGSSDEGT